MPLHIDNFHIAADDFPTTEQYPYSLELVRTMSGVSFDSPITLFVGENGTGKSTILEALARACGVHIWRFETGARYRNNRFEETLYRHIRVGWTRGPVPGAFFGSEIFKDFAYLLDEWASTDPGQLKYFGGESLVTQSHGQSMMAYFQSRYAVKGLYFLDEPETALSPRSQMELMEIIQKNAGAGHAQFVVTTHSPLLLTMEGARIYSFDHLPVKSVSFRETEHFRVYKEFFSGF